MPLIRFRGYALLAVLVALSVLHQQPAYLEVALLLVIVALSKEGSWLAGSLSVHLNRLPQIHSPFAKAVLMAMPVKTLTVMFGATSHADFAAVTVSATAALLLLSLSLGLLATFLVSRPRKAAAEGRRTPRWVTMLDFGLILLLLMLGDDGPKLFGSFGAAVQENLPFLREPMVRGMLAIIPVKTVTTLLLATSVERQRIASHGGAVMIVLAFLTFTAFWVSSYVPVMLALVAGILASFSSFVSLNTFKRVVREEAGCPS